MNKHFKRIIAVLILVTLSLSIYGCGKKKDNTNSPGVQDTQTKKDDKGSLKEQGYEIADLVTQKSGISVVKLSNGGSYFTSIINDKFDWTMEPNAEIIEVGNFSDGLAPAAVAEKNQMRLSNNEEKLWGYIDIKGNWVVKPQFREAYEFADSIALVRTIETDLDTLQNARYIAIDKSGKELFEVYEKHSIYESPYYIQRKFINGYIMTQKDDDENDYKVVDVKGNVYNVRMPENTKPIFNDGVGLVEDKIVATDNSSLIIIDLKGNVVKTLENTSLSTEGGEEEIFNENKMVTRLGNSVRLTDLSGKIYLDTEKLSNEGLLIGNYITFSDGIAVLGNTSEGYLFDTNGNKVGVIKGEIQSRFIHGKAWIKGAEYSNLIDVSGKVLIDESKKIDAVNAYMNGPVTRLMLRETKDSPNMVPCLVNIDTYEVITYSQLLEKSVQ